VAGASAALAIVVSMAAAVALAPAKPVSRPRRPAATGVVRFSRNVYRYTSALSLAAEARRYSVLVLQAPDGRLVRALHRYNPHLLVLMYQFVMYARADDPDGLELCTSLAAARANNWLLRGVRGQLITEGPAYGVDVGIPAFQRSCAEHALALAKRYGFNGVFLDGVGAKPEYQFGPIEVPKYRSAASWMAAMTSFLETASAIIHGGRLKVIANIGGPQEWVRWSSLLDGAEEESWSDGSLGLAQQVPFWGLKLRNVAWSEAHRKYALLHSYNPGEAANVYGLASMLLVAGGYSGYATSNVNSLGDERWFPEYGTAERLGRPRGHYVRLRGGLYERKFAHGLVLVNPTLHAIGGVRLHGTYSGSGRSRVRALALGPTSGLILLYG